MLILLLNFYRYLFYYYKRNTMLLNFLIGFLLNFDFYRLILYFSANIKKL